MAEPCSWCGSTSWAASVLVWKRRICATCFSEYLRDVDKCDPPRQRKPVDSRPSPGRPSRS